MSTLREKFTENAEQFDSLMVEMLAENEGLEKDKTELQDNIEAYRREVEDLKHDLHNEETSNDDIIVDKNNTIKELRELIDSGCNTMRFFQGDITYEDVLRAFGGCDGTKQECIIECDNCELWNGGKK